MHWDVARQDLVGVYQIAVDNSNAMQNQRQLRNYLKHASRGPGTYNPRAYSFRCELPEEHGLWNASDVKQLTFQIEAKSIIHVQQLKHFFEHVVHKTQRGP